MSKIINEFKEYILLVILLVISLILLSQNNHPDIRKVRAFAFGSFAYVNSIITSISDIFSDDSELIEAQKQNAELNLKLNLLREYGLENFELKSMLRYKEFTDYPLITAKVVSRLTSRTEGALILNRGEADSVSSGMAVINADGIVGLVTDVSRNFCLVHTIHNSNIKITVANQRSRVNSIASWDGEKMLLKDVPTTYDFQVGDRIVTSDLSVLYPPSIPVGIVIEKQTKISGLLGNVIIKPFANPEKSTFFFIVKLVKSKQVEELELNLFKSTNE